MRTISATTCCPSFSCATSRTTTRRRRGRNWDGITQMSKATPARCRWRCGMRTTWKTSRSSRNRCGARCITSSSPPTSGTASPTWPAPRMRSCSTPSKRASNTSRRNPLRAPSRACSPRSTLALPSWGKSMRTGTSCFAGSSRKSPKDWQVSRQTLTRWAMPMNT